jgi:hypothetical protein
METSFPDRYYVLRKYSLIGFLIVILFVAATIGCEPRKEYSVDPVPVFSKVVQIDSSYTRVRVIPTGNSYSLFCGKKDIFDSYSIIKFDSIPENFDSLFLRFVSAPCTCEITLFALECEWSEDSIYEWDDIGSLFDTLNPIQVATIYTIPVDSPAVDTNSLIFLGNSGSLDESTIDAIGNFGLAVHSDRFYSFDAGVTRLKIELSDTLDTLAPSMIRCTEDAYIVSNPFQDSIFSDSLLVGRGLSIRTHLLLPRDSLPAYLSYIAKGELFLDVDTVLSFLIESTVARSGFIFYPDYTDDYDSLKCEMGLFFKQADIDSVVDIQIRASVEDGGIGLEKLGGGRIKFIWVELPK